VFVYQIVPGDPLDKSINIRPLEPAAGHASCQRIHDQNKEKEGERRVDCLINIYFPITLHYFNY